MKLHDDLKITVPATKPRNSTYRVLVSKAHAGGVHRDKKLEFKKGLVKHKNSLYQEIIEGELDECWAQDHSFIS